VQEKPFGRVAVGQVDDPLRDASRVRPPGVRDIRTAVAV
jgi:hypothetical protein